MTDKIRQLTAIARAPRFALRLRDETALSEAETALYIRLHAQLAQALARRHRIDPQQAQEMAECFERILGRRGLLRLLVQPPVIFGATRACVAINALACAVIFAVTGSLAALALSAVALHSAAVWWYVRRHDRIINAHIQTIQQKGLRI